MKKKKRDSKTGKRIGFGGILLRKLPLALVTAALLCLAVFLLLKIGIRTVYGEIHSSEDRMHFSCIEKIVYDDSGENIEKQLSDYAEKLCEESVYAYNTGNPLFRTQMSVEVIKQDGTVVVRTAGELPDDCYVLTQLMDQDIEQAAGSKSTVYYGYEEYDDVSIGKRFGHTVRSAEGENYTVLLAYYSDYRDTLGKLAGISFGVIFVISAVILLLLTKHTHTVYKSHYAMEDYRREITNNMAHDLKSPLMAVSGCAEMLANGCSGDKSREYGETILSNVSYMDGIITDVLELAKLEGGSKPKREDADLKKLTEELLSKYVTEISARGISCNISGSGRVSADKNMFSRALDNLISNAVKYTPDGGGISITLSDSGITVENDSTEPLPADTESLWKPFVKGDASRSSESGSGIGLSIVRSVCDAHGFDTEMSCNSGSFSVTISF